MKYNSTVLFLILIDSMTSYCTFSENDHNTAVHIGDVKECLFRGLNLFDSDILKNIYVKKYSCNAHMELLAKNYSFIFNTITIPLNLITVIFK